MPLIFLPLSLNQHRSDAMLEPARENQLALPDRYFHIAGDPNRVQEQESEGEVDVVANFEMGDDLIDSDDLSTSRNVQGGNPINN